MLGVSLYDQHTSLPHSYEVLAPAFQASQILLK